MYLFTEEVMSNLSFFKVHKANWYGDVAVKLLNMDHVDEEKQLEAFKVIFSSHMAIVFNFIEFLSKRLQKLIEK